MTTDFDAEKNEATKKRYSLHPFGTTADFDPKNMDDFPLMTADYGTKTDYGRILSCKTWRSDVKFGEAMQSLEK